MYPGELCSHLQRGSNRRNLKKILFGKDFQKIISFLLIQDPRVTLRFGLHLHIIDWYIVWCWRLIQDFVLFVFSTVIQG